MGKNEINWEDQAARYKAEVVTLQGKHDAAIDLSRTSVKKIVELEQKLTGCEIDLEKAKSKIETDKIALENVLEMKKECEKETAELRNQIAELTKAKGE